jgi:ribosomal protein L36
MNISRILVRSSFVQLTKSLETTRNLSSLYSIAAKQPVSSLCQPKLTSIQSLAGFKHVANPKRRCKHCYIVYEEDRSWVFCDKYPRHKQVFRISPRQMKNQMIMTHATQGATKSGSNPRGRMHMWTQDGFRMDF